MFDNKSDYALNKKDQDSIVYNKCTNQRLRCFKVGYHALEEFSSSAFM